MGKYSDIFRYFLHYSNDSKPLSLANVSNLSPLPPNWRITQTLKEEDNQVILQFRWQINIQFASL